MNEIDIDTLIFILNRDYINYGYNEYIDSTITKLTREIIRQKVRSDKDFMKLLHKP